MEKEIVSVVRCDSYDNKEVKKALEDSLKNINFNFKKNMKVLIKPNILLPVKPSKHITTNPIVLQEICKILKKYNAEIIIAESSSYNTDEGFKISGIEEACKKYAKIINLEKTEKIQTIIDKKGKKLFLPRILFNVDLVINVAKLKTHNLTQMTACIKNQFGFISGSSKEAFHRIFPKPKDFVDLLLNIHKKIKPQLNIIDGIIGLEGNGPGTSGIPIKTGVIIASKDAIAADIVAANVIGYKKNKVLLLKRAEERGLFNKKIEIKGEKNFRKTYRKPSIISIELFSGVASFLGKPKIKFNYEKCIKCGICEKKCPVKAINLSPFPTCNNNKCIRCLCCTEVCPKGAPYLQDSPARRIIKNLIEKFRIKSKT